MTPTRIEIDAGTRVSMTWDDGMETDLTAADLRAACRCAACREPAGEEATALVVGGPVPVTIDDAKLVGSYAIAFVFAPDGHSTGIYPFSSLRELGSRKGSPNA
jgi:ATP-binding protein involved in chromosome partitioning